MPLEGSSTNTDNRLDGGRRRPSTRASTSSAIPIYRYLRITKGGPGGVPGEASEQDLDRRRLAAAPAPHPPAPERVVGLRHRRALALPARARRHAPRRRVDAPPVSDAEAVHAGDVPSAALVEETMRMAGPAARRRPRPVRPLLRRELPRRVGHRPRGHRPRARHAARWPSLIGGARRVARRRLRAGRADRSALGRVPHLVGRARGLRAPGWLAALEAGAGRAVLGRQHGLRPSRLLYMWRRRRAGRRPADPPLLVHLGARPDAARARGRGAVHVPQRPALPLPPGLLPPDGAADRPPAARGLPADARRCCSAATRSSAWTATSRSPSGRCFRRSTAGPAARAMREQRELGAAWAAIVARKLKWKLIYQGTSDARDIPSGALRVTREEFARRAARAAARTRCATSSSRSTWRPRNRARSTR